ncbi:MAG: hypothetical protein A3J51_03270 [Omnitrophica WOR_2 bacterium RIFCSPHIGHO2_02_FULL_45_21]|nr:MAG: hypothetical protein A3J51_03270 [Omnitrophica WOR_2 bacterium RIFCSPHIGHO2_02_FULL_45_21]
MKRSKSVRNDKYIKAIYILAGIIIIESVFLLASCQRKVKPLPRKQPAQVQKKPAPEAEPKPEGSGLPSDRQSHKPKVPEDYQGKIAIVLDDWGYSLSNADALKEIKEPLTLAILPRRTYSATIAGIAKEIGKETILHLPLQPQRQKKYRFEPDTILITMTRQEVLKILEADIKNLPGINGVSNHMGSLATENEPLMKIIFNELKKRKLYFLDSYTAKSVCKGLAGNVGLAYARRQVFLDNKNDAQYIRGQLELLARIARQSGYAIGIGHDRPKTLEVLSRAMRELKKRGFKFVYVSELVK